MKLAILSILVVAAGIAVTCYSFYKMLQHGLLSITAIIFLTTGFIWMTLGSISIVLLFMESLRI